MLIECFFKLHPLAPPPPAEVQYSGSPLRPRKITGKDKKANDIEIDDNAKVVISLDILHNEDEKIVRLVQVATPTGVGQQRACYILITSACTYILKKGKGVWLASSSIHHVTDGVL